MRSRHGVARKTVWIVPVLIVLIAIWVARMLFSQPPAAKVSIGQPMPKSLDRRSTLPAAASPVPTPTPTAPLEHGANLLQNPGFTTGSKGWTEFHNARIMRVAYLARGGMVTIAPGNATQSVEEILQNLSVPAGSAIVASGAVSISGAALPPSWTVRVFAVDGAGKGIPITILDAQNGAVGAHPFSVAIDARDGLKQIVLAVITGTATSDRTVIGFEDLSIAIRKP